jgi:hypothetical protein
MYSIKISIENEFSIVEGEDVKFSKKTYYKIEVKRSTIC